MRLIVIHLVATLALILVASTADAYRVDMAAFLNGAPYAGEALQLGDQIEIRVDLDTEDQADIALLAVGLLFDDTTFTYNEPQSSSTSYLLYVSAKTPYMVPASTCLPACRPFLTRQNQIQLDFFSSNLPSGIPTTTAQDLSVGGPQLVSLIFDVANTSAGSADFVFDFDPFFGSILQLGDTTNPPLTLGPSVTINVPEPASAILSLVAIGTVAALRRGRRIA